MKLSDLAAILTGIQGFSGKVAYYAFPAGSAPALPFITYQETGSDNFLADDSVFIRRKTVDIELYTELKSESIETALEDALGAAGIIWEKEETYLDTERCYMLTYSITI